MNRRTFLAMTAGAAVSQPNETLAQQNAMPTVGFMSGQSSNTYTRFADAFRQGLSDTGYIEGRNVAIEYRWAEGSPDALPALAADFVHRRVAS